MKLKLVRSSRGAHWVRLGFEIFFLRPMAFSGLFGMFLLALLLPPILPVIGPVLLLACMPLLTMGFMLGTQRALRGEYPKPTVFIEPLRMGRPQTKAFVQLGVSYAIAMVLAVTVSDWINDGRLEALAAAYGTGKATPESISLMLDDPRLQLSVLFFFTAFSLLSVPFWHAPALVYWGGHSAAKAMFASTIACWRNKGAFMMYGLTWAGVMFAFSVLSLLLFSLIGQPQWAAIFTMPATLMFSVVFYVSLFFTFADCFEFPAAAKPVGPSEVTRP